MRWKFIPTGDENCFDFLSLVRYGSYVRMYIGKQDGQQFLNGDNSHTITLPLFIEQARRNLVPMLIIIHSFLSYLVALWHTWELGEAIFPASITLSFSASFIIIIII